MYTNNLYFLLNLLLKNGLKAEMWNLSFYKAIYFVKPVSEL